MIEMDADDGTALERALGDSAALAAGFDAALRGLQGTLEETTRDLGRLDRGFSGGLRRAFDGLILDGRSLSDSLGQVARSMMTTAYAAAVDPVMKQAGGMLAQGINAAVSGVMPFAAGAPFAAGRVMPFAKGGVVSGPTSFALRGGIGLMGEAGPEAIMPLARGPDGRLGVRAGGGPAVHVTMHVSTPDVQGFHRSQSQIAARLGRALGRGQRNI